MTLEMHLFMRFQHYISLDSLALVRDYILRIITNFVYSSVKEFFSVVKLLDSSCNKFSFHIPILFKEVTCVTIRAKGLIIRNSNYSMLDLINSD